MSGVSSGYLLPEEELSHRRPKRVAETSDGRQGRKQEGGSSNALLTWDDIDDWRRDNEYIVSGYRRLQRSFRGCIHSIYGYLHNETVNIHSHLIGAILFVWFLITFQQTYIARYEGTSWLDTSVFAIFLTSAVICLLFSASYHTFDAHSEEVSVKCHALDYSGIVVLTLGSFFPCIYYGFYCDPHYQLFYLSVLSLAGIGAAYIVLNPEYRKPTHRGARTTVFIALGLCGVIPVTHGLFTHGFEKLCFEMGFGWLLLSASFYIGGALLYANRIPERLSPGTFDYFGASHQIFHFCVVFAALSHYACVLTAFEHWHSKAGQC
ncbi:HlyIII-domain-containing protein [Panus rudis PR-1116 ss-1]|nr:HlyIII-domain-containing protein [Panus rudis PR-1116 ss-1]